MGVLTGRRVPQTQKRTAYLVKITLMTNSFILGLVAIFVIYTLLKDFCFPFDTPGILVS